MELKKGVKKRESGSPSSKVALRRNGEKLITRRAQGGGHLPFRLLREKRRDGKIDTSERVLRATNKKNRKVAQHWGRNLQKVRGNKRKRER